MYVWNCRLTHFIPGGVLNEQPINSSLYAGTWILEIIFYCVTNAFAILSGFLYAKKKVVNYYRLLNLLAIVFFWSIVICAAFKIALPSVVSKENVFYGLFPVLQGRYWYITCYILMFLMIPYINIIVRTLDQKKYKSFLLLLFILLSVFPTVCKTDFFRTGNGYSPWWLIFNYFIGAYFSIYGFGTIKKWKLFLIFCINTFLVFLCVLSDQKIIDGLQYTSPMIVGNAVCLFGMLHNVNIKKYRTQKIVVALSAAAFDVYIMHAHIWVYDYLIKDSFKFIQKYHLTISIAIILTGILTISFIGFIGGWIRKGFFKILKVNGFLKLLGSKITHFLYLERL